MNEPQPESDIEKLSEELRRHLDPATHPKRILSLDGGGVRGVIALEFLARIETTLRDRYRRPDLVLSDYFDLIGGTSTGAIIAAGLALGMSVDKIRGHYQDLGPKVFKKPRFRIGALIPKFSQRAIEASLKEVYEPNRTMGSGDLKTGLLIVTKRMDTGSPWPITNNPRDPYYQSVVGKQRVGNANMLLWQLVRASTAAPHFFKPEPLVVGYYLDPQSGDPVTQRGEFVDGGVSTANNPALQLLVVALLSRFGFGWRSGAENLLMVSLGTGLRDTHRGKARGLHALAGPFAVSALRSIMDDTNDLVETMMQWLSEGPARRRIDGQIRDLSNELLAARELLTYRRYNIELKQQWMKEVLGITLTRKKLDHLTKLDAPGNMPELAELAAAAAEVLIPDADLDRHLPPGFDLDGGWIQLGDAVQAASTEPDSAGAP